MPLIRRSVADMIGHFSKHTDVLVCPTSLSGSMRGGLANAFAERWPRMADEYREACSSGQLTVGSLHIHYDEASKNTIICLPTKDDWRDISNIKDIETGCINLAAYLRDHPTYTVAMPLLGGGTARFDPVDIPQILTRHLEPLPNIIHLSIRPERFTETPRYLAVVGSRAYNDYLRIEFGIMDGLIQFGLSYKDFEAMVSGGARGVDRVACGRGNPEDTELTIAKHHGLRAIVCQADWKRYGDSAGYVRNYTVADIGTHFVAFIGSRSNGTKNTINLVNTFNNNVDKLMNTIHPTDDDVFTHQPLVIPEKKQIYICDISAISP